MRTRVFWIWIALGSLCAQEPAGVPAQPGQTPAATPGAAAPAAIENNGKPMTVAFECTAEDVRWAGLTCSEDEPCPIYLELTAADGMGDRIVAAGNFHSSSVTLDSVVLASDDAGRTWRESAERIRGAGLDRIQLLDAEHGWISGQVLFPLAQDPFLLVTSDGGKSWRQRPVLSESAENRNGSIQQFFFSDKSSGNLLLDRGAGSDGDRYEMYESSDGESWSIQETSKAPLKLKRSPPPSSDWRVRADGPSKSFHIEHRQGERWTSSSAFLVRAGTCKPE
jgi:hypothetical protein